MNTVVINIKTQPETKIKAQTIAKELGLNLSSIINAYLTQLIKTKTVTFSVSEEPTNYLLDMLRKSKKDIKAGRIISFETWDKEKGYLDKLIANDKSNKG